MKRTAISSVAVIILSWMLPTAHAQFAYNVTKANSAASFTGNPLAIPNMVNDVKGVSAKAGINFTKAYKNATDVMWYPLKDRRLMVRFFDNGIQTKVFYNMKGNKDAMIRYYTEDKLPNEVRRQVKSIYYDFNIFMVIEVTVGKQIAYLVKIEDKTCTKTIRVMNGEADVIEEFDNL